jgi:hypothetical protein
MAWGTRGSPHEMTQAILRGERVAVGALDDRFFQVIYGSSIPAQRGRPCPPLPTP